MPAPDDAQPLVTERVTKIVADVATRLGLDATGARRLKFTINAVVLLPAARVVLRIPGSATPRARVPAMLEAAKWFAAQGLPTARLWPHVEQPVHVGADLVTIWHQVDPGGREPTATDLGAVLRAIHALDQHPPDLPTWSITAGIRARLAVSPDLDADDVAFLRAELTAVEHGLAALPGIAPLVPPGVIHGDAHVGNLIPSPAGPVLCDFDSTSIGPREWDLTPAAVGALRFPGRAEGHRRLVDAYGADVTGWPGFATLRRLRELQLVTSVLPVLDANPALRPQWRHRLTSLRVGDGGLWMPYADLGA